METVRIKLSKNTVLNHLIMDDPSSAHSYSSLVMMNEHYKELDIDYELEHDWRYYFIVKRTFLRHRKIDGRWECHYCKKPIYKMPLRNKRTQNMKDKVTIDHKVPACRCDDVLDTSNFLVSCYKCNIDKSDTSYEIFYKNGNFKTKK